MTEPARCFATEDLVVDRALAELAESFRFLLDLTPLNIEEARREFASGAREPDFVYRDLEDPPELAAARLAAVPVDSVQDPILATLFAAKRREISLQLDMLTCRNTSDLLPLSVELYGTVGDALLAEAESILRRVAPERSAGRWIGSDEIVRRADVELAWYREQLPDLEAKIETRPGTAGLMVSNGDLLVSPTSRISEERIGALLHHEIGTHIVTHVNGAHQPLHVLASGLAGHDETQEGLAVLAECIVGGLTSGRLRQLAARVVAVHAMVEGASFHDVHARLAAAGVGAEQAFTITVRVFRSGGLTKDAIYLRGLHDIVEHLRRGGSLDPLWLGKMPLSQMPLVDQLHAQGFLIDPVLTPRYLEDPAAGTRLTDIRSVGSLTDLIGSSA